MNTIIIQPQSFEHEDSEYCLGCKYLSMSFCKAFGKAPCGTFLHSESGEQKRCDACLAASTTIGGDDE